MICLGAGMVSVTIVCAIWLIELLFILIKKPYTIGLWKRPVANKALGIVICVLYAGASLTDPKSAINTYIPLVVLGVLMITLTYSSITVVKDIK